MMMLCLLAAGGLLLSGTTTPLAPPVALALDLAEAVGASVSELRLDSDGSITDNELQALRSALEGTGLFTVASEAGVRLHLRRVEAAWVLSSVVQELDGSERRLWVGRSAWPENSSSMEPEASERALESLPSSEEIYAKVRTYRRRRLSLRPITKTLWGPTLAVGIGGYGGAGPWGHRPGYYGHRAHWQVGYQGPPVGIPLAMGWGIAQGRKFLDELVFARLIGDEELKREIEKQRASKRRRWLIGFGVGSAVGLGSGAGLFWSDLGGRDVETLGLSLMSLGVLSAVLTAFTPWVGRSPIQTTDEAQRRIDAFNTDLRDRLDVSPEDLAAYPPEG